jgi:hypothetical protein
MRPNLIKSSLLLLSLGLVGCTTSGGGGTAGSGTAAAPAATGTVVAQGDMAGFCQNAAAAKYNTALENISTNTPVTRSFGLLIQGSVDTDTNTFGFDCRFDSTGAFLGLITQ